MPRLRRKGSTRIGSTELMSRSATKHRRRVFESSACWLQARAHRICCVSVQPSSRRRKRRGIFSAQSSTMFVRVVNSPAAWRPSRSADSECMSTPTSAPTNDQNSPGRAASSRNFVRRKPPTASKSCPSYSLFSRTNDRGSTCVGASVPTSAST
ncbi:hypothetical protein T492DRAFT_1066783 [Pavlovales sp. CCMP2436]|nr:hypothetical protein T492DRAFT_1066783 [Pavlovales sp. CCMP2436]